MAITVREELGGGVENHGGIVDRDKLLEGIGGGEGGLEEGTERGELVGDGRVLVNENKDLGELEAKEGGNGEVLWVREREKEDLVEGEKRRQNPAGEKGTGVGVSDVEKEIDAEAALAWTLQENATELDQSGENDVRQVWGGEKEEKVPVVSSAMRISVKVI